MQLHPDPEQVKRYLGKTAKMTFRFVDTSATPEEAASGSFRRPPRATPRYAPAGRTRLLRDHEAGDGERREPHRRPAEQPRRHGSGINFDLQRHAFLRGDPRQCGKLFAIVLMNKA